MCSWGFVAVTVSGGGARDALSSCCLIYCSLLFYVYPKTNVSHQEKEQRTTKIHFFFYLSFFSCRSVQPDDAGKYECQVSTLPKKSHFLHLSVIGKFVQWRIVIGSKSDKVSSTLLDRRMNLFIFQFPMWKFLETVTFLSNHLQQFNYVALFLKVSCLPLISNGDTTKSICL